MALALFGAGCIAVAWGTGLLDLSSFGKPDLYGSQEERQQRETFVEAAPMASYAAIQAIPNAKFNALSNRSDPGPLILPAQLTHATLRQGGQFHIVVNNLDHYDLLKEELHKYLADNAKFTADSCNLVTVLADFNGKRALDDTDFSFGDHRVVVCATATERLMILAYDTGTVLPFSFIKPMLVDNQDNYVDAYKKQMWSEYSCDCMFIMRDGGGVVVRPTSYSVCPN